MLQTVYLWTVYRNQWSSTYFISRAVQSSSVCGLSCLVGFISNYLTFFLFKWLLLVLIIENGNSQTQWK